MSLCEKVTNMRYDDGDGDNDPPTLCMFSSISCSAAASDPPILSIIRAFVCLFILLSFCLFVYFSLTFVFFVCFIFLLSCLQSLFVILGHSGEIGNAPNLTGKKTKIMLGMCSTHFYLWFEVLMLKKDVGKLKITFCTFSPPNFGVPVSRGDKDIFEIFPSTRQ